MYTIKADGELLYASNIPELKLVNAVINKNINRAGSLTFTLLSTHPFYNRLERLKSNIEVYKNGKLIFIGRLLETEVNFLKQKKFICEGALSYLNDSILEPYDFLGTPRAYLEKLLTQHNLQVLDDRKIYVGEVTVHTLSSTGKMMRRKEDYINTLDELLEKTTGSSIGGYIRLRRDENTKKLYLDWLEDFNDINPQTIDFGSNLLDYNQRQLATDIATVVIPLGARAETEDGSLGPRANITSVNDNKLYIEHPEAIAKYGRIVKTQVWDDVTSPSNLLRKGQKFLNKVVKQSTEINLTALDLSLVNKDISSFVLGDKIKVSSEPHNLDETLLLKKQSINLLRPELDTISLGQISKSFTDTVSSAQGVVSAKINSIEANYATNTKVQKVDDKAKALEELTSKHTTQINQLPEQIELSVSENFYPKDETDKKIASVNSSLQMTKNNMELKFNQLDTRVTANGKRLNELNVWYRWTDEYFEIGRSDSNIIQRIYNDKTQIIENGEITYEAKSGKQFVKKELVIGEGSILTLGNFAFFPRQSGNLSFMKVGN